MTEKAKVTKILSGHTAAVFKLPDADCGGECFGCLGCETPKEQPDITVSNTIGAKPGDIVYIESDRRKTNLILFTVFGLPIFVPLFLYFTGYALGLPAAINITMAVLGLFAAFINIKRLNKKIKNSGPVTKIVSVQRGDFSGIF